MSENVNPVQKRELDKEQALPYTIARSQNWLSYSVTKTFNTTSAPLISPSPARRAVWTTFYVPA